jgi:hypothetical protein
MRKRVRVVSIVVAATVLLAILAGAALAGPPIYEPHLKTLGFDTLGEPSNGLNTEIVIVIDANRKFAYVGSLNFDPSEDDLRVKAVDVSDPANPVVTDEQETLDGTTTAEGNFGPFDVKVAGDVLAASTQGIPAANPGITLMDIGNRADPVPASHLDGAAIKSPDGSHNSFLWADPTTSQTWLFACGLDDTSMMLFDVSDPYSPLFVAEYNNGGPVYVHDCFTQMNSGRVLHYQAGSIGVEILDVTRVVRGGQPGPFGSADVVAVNHYTSDAADAETVTRPGFAHYIEPNASGSVAWVGDESGCGDPGIVRALDASNLPTPGNPPKFLDELSAIIENPDTTQCSGAIHANPASHAQPQLQEYRWTGHNFDVYGDGLLVRGDYGRGVSVYDISNPTAPVKVAKSRGLNQGTGDENQVDPGRDKALENPTFIWAAVYDGDLIYASDINQGIYVLDLIGD